MEDKYNENEYNKIIMLKKKTSRRKKLQKLDKEFDLEKYKEKILKELSHKELEKHQGDDFIDNENKENLILEYEIKFKKYIQQELSYNILVFINRIIMESKSITSHIRCKYPLHKILLNVVKIALLNELELVYFSILLDKLGWESMGFSLEDNLLLTALAVKMYLNDNFKFIIEYLNRTRTNYLNLLNKWLESKKDYNILSIAPRDINIKFNQLIKPSNSFCKNNFIDFNFVVDQILQMSIPYNDSKNPYSNNQTDLSKFSFTNDIPIKPINYPVCPFTNSQNSMFSRFISSNNILLNKSKNPSIQSPINCNIDNQQEKNIEKTATFISEIPKINKHYNIDMTRFPSGIFDRLDSDSIFLLPRDYSALNNYDLPSRESSNNFLGDEEKNHINLFRKYPNAYQNINQTKSEDHDKNLIKDEKQDVCKQFQSQSKLSLNAANNNENSNNIYKIIKGKDNNIYSNFGKDT